MYLNYIGVGASLAGPVLAGPLFGDIIINIFKNYGHASPTLTTAGQLQSSSYAPLQKYSLHNQNNFLQVSRE